VQSNCLQFGHIYQRRKPGEFESRATDLIKCVNTNNNNENINYSESGSSGEEGNFAPLFKARETMKELIKKVHEDCSRVESKSKEIEEVLEFCGGVGIDRPTISMKQKMRSKSERERHSKLRDNLVAKLRSLQSSTRDLEEVLKILYRLEQEVHLKAQAGRREAEVAQRSNAVLKAAVAKQEEEMQEMTTYVSRLEAEVKERKAENNAEIVKLIETTQRMKAEMASMRANHSSLVVESQRVVERLGIVEEQKDNLESQMKEISGEKENLEREKEEKEREIERQRRKVKEGKDKFDGMQLKMAQFRGEMTDLIAQVQDRNESDNSSLSTMESKISTLQRHLLDSEAETRRLQVALRRKEEEAEELATSAVVRKAEEERRSAEEAFKRIRNFLFESTTELKKMDDEAAALRRELRVAEEDVLTLKEEVVRLNSVVDAYERKTVTALEENRILKELVDEQRTNLSRVDTDNFNLKEDAEQFKSKMRDYASKLQHLPEELQRVETELATTNTAVDDLHRRLRLQDAELEKQAVDARAAILERDREIEEMRSQMKTLETELRLRERQLEVIDEEERGRRKNGEKEEDVEEGEKGENKKEEENERLRSEIARLKGREAEYSQVLQTLIESRENLDKLDEDAEKEKAELKTRLKIIKRKLDRSVAKLREASAEKTAITTKMEAEKKRIFDSLSAEKNVLIDMLENLKAESTKSLAAADQERTRVLAEKKAREEAVDEFEAERKVLLEEIQVLQEKEEVMDKLLEKMDKEKEEEQGKRGEEEVEKRELKARSEEARKEADSLRRELERERQERLHASVDLEEKIQNEYSTKFFSLQAEVKETRKENKRLGKQKSHLEEEVRRSRVEAEQERRKRESVERRVGMLRGVHTRMFFGGGGGGGEWMD